MACDSNAHDRGVSARLRARVQTLAAELSTLAARSRESEHRLLAMSRADLECATMRLTLSLDSLELEHLDHWLDMVESQLGTVRAALAPAPVRVRRPRVQARGRRTSLDTIVQASHTPPATAPRNSNMASPG